VRQQAYHYIRGISIRQLGRPFASGILPVGDDGREKTRDAVQTALRNVRYDDTATAAPRQIINTGR
jgi:hypothetical protein